MMKQDADTIAVIICAYTEQRWDDLLAGVQALRQQTVAPNEIILVIDHNRSLFERVQQALPDVTVRENRGQRGLSGARNTGVQATHCTIMAFLDDDALPSLSWIEQILSAYSEPAVWGVGGMIQPAWPAGRPGWFPEEFDWVVGCTYRGMPTIDAPVRNLIGANMSFRRAVFEAVGGFRDGMGRLGTLPMGCEETELCIRLRQHQPQAEIRYRPAAMVSHRIDAARTHFHYFLRRCRAEGRSKAQVARFVGSQAGLANERGYAMHTLPEGVVRGIGNSLRGDWHGLVRAGVIMLGLAATVVGYAEGRWMQQHQTRSDEQPTMFTQP
jgi:GT2 family glycosyltransferase